MNDAIAPESVVAKLDAQIDEAHALMREGSRERGLQLFAEIRSFASKGRLSSMAEKLQRNTLAHSEEERDTFRRAISGVGPLGSTGRIAIMSDSLGLPRPGQPLRSQNGLHTNYANGLNENFKRLSLTEKAETQIVEPLCQRYATTETVLGWLSDKKLELNLDGADVILHVGLNDFSTRMFLEKERLSLSLLPPELTQKIVRFAQGDHYRADLINAFPDHCYVKPAQFEKNVEKIIQTLRKRGARSITYVGMIQLPMSVMSHTPNYCWNFTRYMNRLYQICWDNDVGLLDLSRLFWEDDFYACVLKDLMHLSPYGHIFLANRLTEMLSGVARYDVLEKKSQHYARWINTP